MQTNAAPLFPCPLLAFTQELTIFPVYMMAFCEC